MSIEYGIRKIAIDVGEHFGHEVLSDLALIVAQTIGVFGIARA